VNLKLKSGYIGEFDINNLSWKNNEMTNEKAKQWGGEWRIAIREWEFGKG
jgi:hypothetical protein